MNIWLQCKDCAKWTCSLSTTVNLYWSISPYYNYSYNHWNSKSNLEENKNSREKKIEDWFARDISSAFFHAFKKCGDHRVRHYLSNRKNEFFKFTTFNGFLDSFSFLLQKKIVMGDIYFTYSIIIIWIHKQPHIRKYFIFASY